MLVTWSGTNPAQAAQAGIRLPPTLEADKPENKYIYKYYYNFSFLLQSFLKNPAVLMPLVKKRVLVGDLLALFCIK